MKHSARKLTRRLKKRRQALLERYDEEDLHQLRITLRRMRGRLKGAGKRRLRQLRKDLGTLADATNAARDWDTLEAHARLLLGLQQFENIAPWLRRNQRAARERVTELLASRTWADTIEDWKRRAPDVAVDRGTTDARLEETWNRVDTARQKALSLDTDRHWHKLRIAIKELRYRLDEQPGEDRNRQTRMAISTCKQVQEELGTWHDTVVHRGLLAEAAAGGAEDSSLAATLAILDDKLVREGEECLERVRAMLVEPAVERALSPGPR